MEKFVRDDNRGNIMKKFLYIFLALVLTGCASITIPNYIQDKNPYKRTLYAPFDKVREVTIQTFEDFGWAVEKESKPALFERERESGNGGKQTLLFSKIRQTSFFVGSRYSRLNVYLREMASNKTEVEIRYLTVTSVLFKSFYGYKNDRSIERIFRRIEEKLDLP